MTWEFLLVGLIGQGFRGYYSGKGKSGGGSIVGGFLPKGKEEEFDKMRQEAKSGDNKKGDLVQRIYNRLDAERLFNPNGKTATEAGFKGFKVQKEDQDKKEILKTAAGTKVSVSIIGGEVDFKINDRSGTSNVVDPVASGKLALGTAKQMAAKLPDGTLLYNSPYDADATGAARDRVYRKLGFGETIDDVQYTIIKGGKAYPVDRKFYNKYIKPEVDAGNFPP